MMESAKVGYLLNELQNLLYSNSNIKNVAESAEKYKNIIIFDINHIDLSNPIEELPENSSIDEISLTKLPADFNHLMPVEITANGSCLMNSLSFIFTATDDFSIHFRLATLLEMIINYKFYLTQRIFEQDYIYSNSSFNRTTNCNNLEVEYNKENEYLNELRLISHNYSFCSMVAVHGLASVIKRPIQSIYPPTNIKFLQEIYCNLIHPRPQPTLYTEPVHILWTVTDMSLWNSSFPSPNHFVACFKFNEVINFF